MKKRVTRNDVAKLAGVSTAVVSYVINDGPRGVAPKTRERVLAAIQELGYRTNHIARSLRSRQTNTLGIIVDDSSNIYYSEVVRAIENEAYSQNFTILVGNTDNNIERLRKYIDNFISREVSGIIFVGEILTLQEADLLTQFNIPAVCINSEGELEPIVKNYINSIEITTKKGGYDVGVHLLEGGHQRIACIVGKEHQYPSSIYKWLRLDGLQQALGEAGLKPQVIGEGEMLEDGYRAASQLLQSENPPSAIFACNDLVAIGVLRAAADFKLHVPSDLAVCGFDDLALTKYITPRLTTVNIPKSEIGVKAAQVIIDRIQAQSGKTDEGEALAQIELIKFDTTLVVRESS